MAVGHRDRTYVAAILLLCVAVGVLTLRLSQSKGTIDANRRAVAAQRAAQDRDHQTLAELCKTNSAIEGSLANTIRLLKDEIRTGELPADVVAAERRALDVFEGYQLDLARATACPEVKNP